MSSLQDQLLKAGLVDEKKVKKANKDKRKEQKQQHNSKDALVDEVKAAAVQARAEKAERDRRLNEQRKAENERKAVAAQIRQLIEMNSQSKGDSRGDLLGYNFTDGRKVKKIYVSAAVQQQLAKGRLAIVKQDDQYKLVPAAVADKIMQRDRSCVLSLQAATPAVDEDDPYKDYQIPDDLMW